MARRVAHPPPPPLAPLDTVARKEPFTGGAEDLGIVMGGGGARAAYQVGFLRALARLFPNLRIPYVTGVSAGAINAAHLASHHGTFLQCAQELTDLWARLSVEDVFRTDTRSLAMNVIRWGTQLLSGGAPHRHVRSLVDTHPLREYLTDVLHAVDGEITGIGYNIATGRLRAAAISTSSYTTGQSVTWVQGKDIETWERPQRRAHRCVLTVEHVMASTALPLFFPAVELEDGWHGDGSVRLTAPLSPALHLGARRIIAISTRYAATYEEADRPEVRGYPPPAQVAGILMNSIFLDLLDNDALELQRLNALLERLPSSDHQGLRPLKLLILRPSKDLGKLSSAFEPDLPRGVRFLTRGLGTRDIQSPDFLSFILFQRHYVCTLMDLGERDAMARADEIDAFIRGGPAPPDVTP